jgi:8-oxo-dGTP pyrophosphatase MutT (NUDIX family)
METHNNPWKTLSSRSVYENPWIQIREDQVINPSGGNGIYGVVHMKNKAIGVIPIDQDGYTYLVGQYRYTLNEYSWETPMGGGHLDTDPLESAKRELKEETGFTAAKWTFIAHIHTSNSVTDEDGYVFLAEELTAGDTAFEETEDLSVIRVHMKEAIEMVMDNRITDAISVAGILKVARLLNM